MSLNKDFVEIEILGEIKMIFLWLLKISFQISPKKFYVRNHTTPVAVHTLRAYTVRRKERAFFCFFFPSFFPFKNIYLFCLDG